MIRALSAREPFEDGADLRAMRAAEGVVIRMVASGKYVYIDRGMAKITGYTAQEIATTELEFLDKLSRALRRYRHVVKCAPYLCQYETVIYRKDGKAVPVEITASEILWQEKEAFQVFVRVTGGMGSTAPESLQRPGLSD